MIRRSASIALLLALPLAGCGGLLGGGGKADLYRFGYAPPVGVAQDAYPAGRPTTIAFAGTRFAPAIRGDRLLTITGSSAAYVAKARWVSPADTLFDATIVASMDRLSSPIRLASPEDAPLADNVLQVDVQHFEAVYADPAAAPSVLIVARVTLIRRADRRLIGERPITLNQPAGENHVPAIVAAFDQASDAAAQRIAMAVQELARTPAT